MVKEEIEIQITGAMEVRPVAMLVQLASRFDSAIYIEHGSRNFNAKSIMGMMTLGLNSGETITISADGADEKEALETLTGYLTGKSLN